MSTITSGVTVPTALTFSGDTTGAITFQVSGTVTAATITSAGNVGIGTASPSGRLHVSAGTQTALNLQVATGGYAWLLGTSGYTGNASVGFIDDGGSGGLGINQYDSGGAYVRRAVTLNSSGNVGIGATPLSVCRFYVVGSDTTNGNYSVIFRNSATTNLFYVQNDGGLSTGTAAASPYYNTTGSSANVVVDVNGFLLRSTSSLRYKSDVTDATHGLAEVLKLRSVTYKSKKDGDTVFGGLIAEEVHDAGLTEFVSYNKEGRPDAIHYGNMVALLTKAIQEQQTMIDELKAKVAALETK
jgi:hypothetical protein